MSGGGLGNTPDRFGAVTRLLHWTMAVLILGLFAMGTYIEEMRPSPSNVWLFDLHKSFGITLLGLVVLRILWHVASPPPRPLPGSSTLHDSAARWAHRALYALMLAAPLAGWVGSAATGIDVTVFGMVTLPSLVPVSEGLEEAMFELHEVLTTALVVLAGLHAAAGVIRRDGTLGRMVRGEVARRGV